MRRNYIVCSETSEMHEPSVSELQGHTGELQLLLPCKEKGNEGLTEWSKYSKKVAMSLRGRS